MIFLALGTLSWVILLGLLVALVVVFIKLIKSGKKEAPGLPPPLPQDAADLTLPAGATTNIVGVTPDRLYALVQVIAGGGFTTTCRLGTAATGAARGLELAPGDIVRVDGTAALYIYNPGAAAGLVSVLQVRS